LEETGLFNLLIELSGLGHDAVKNELMHIINSLGLDHSVLTEGDIRRVLSVYLFELHHNHGIALCDSSCSCENGPLTAAEA
jgi:hypothetical protein